MGVSLDRAEHAALVFEPFPPPRWATPGEFARHIEPTTKQTPALDLIDAALVEAFNTPDARLIDPAVSLVLEVMLVQPESL